MRNKKLLKFFNEKATIAFLVFCNSKLGDEFIVENGVITDVIHNR